MNELLKEFSEQAVDYAHATYIAGSDPHLWNEAYRKKFAELIVQECLAIAKNREDELENANLIEESNAVGNVAYRISRQFGVKR